MSDYKRPIVLILTEKDFRPGTDFTSQESRMQGLRGSIFDVQLADMVYIVDNEGNNHSLKVRFTEREFSFSEMHFLTRPQSFTFFNIRLPGPYA